MTRRTSLLLLAPGLALALFAIGAVAGSPPDAPASSAAAGSRAVPVAAAPAAAAVDTLRRTVRRVPGNYRAWTQLGTVHLEQGRVSGDPATYRQAEGAFDRALALRPNDADALAGSAALAAARHDFSGALRRADAALKHNAYSGGALAVRADALTELGRYEEASSTVEQLLQLRPGTAAFSRASYLLELRGDLSGARGALEQAVAFGPRGSELAFLRLHLGELAWQQGDLDRADRDYAAALAADPATGAAQAGRARVLAARGETDAALTSYTDLVTRQPRPEHLIELGELLQSLGRQDEAQQQYDVVRATLQLLKADGAVVDRELALFEADHGDPQAALALSAAALRATPDSVLALDGRAWALHAAGRDVEALPLARRAARLGSRAPLVLFHLGVVELQAGVPEAGRRALQAAVGANPRFSPLLAPEARRLSGA